MSTEIQEYSKTEQAIAVLRKKYAKVTFEVDTTDGMKDAKSARSEIRGYRVDLEKMRKDIKAPALDRCKLIDQEARRITGELVSLEQPIDLQIKEVEAQKEKERQAKIDTEFKRVETIQSTIDAIQAIPTDVSVNSSSEQIAAKLAEAKAVEITDFFEEFTDRAEVVKETSILTLEDLYNERLKYESEQKKIKAERAELAELRAKQEKRDAEDREELEAKRKKQEAEQAEIDNEKKRIADDRKKLEQEQAEAKRKADAEKEAERKRKEKAQAAAKKAQYPGDAAIVEALAEHFDVPIEVATTWFDRIGIAA